MRCPTLSELPPPPPGKTGWPWTEESEQLPDTMPDGSPWPCVSIVTPSYNQAEFIEETIRSVLLQGYPDLEYIIIDGGSTDGSVDIIRKYEPWLTYWVSEPDEGQSDAINKGWRHTTGDFLGWINSDDLLIFNSLGTIIRYFQENPEVGFVFGDLEMIDAQGRHIRFQRYKNFDLVDIVRRTGWISQQGNLFRRAVFEQVGFLDTSLHFLMDLDYWIRAGLICKFGYLHRVVARFRRYDDTKTASKTYLAARDILTVYDKLFNRVDLPLDISQVREESWGNIHLYAARMWYIANRMQEAWSELLQAYEANPRIILSRSFILFLAQLLVMSLLGGRYSRIAHYIRRLRERRWVAHES